MARLLVASKLLTTKPLVGIRQHPLAVLLHTLPRPLPLPGGLPSPLHSPGGLQALDDDTGAGHGQQRPHEDAGGDGGLDDPGGDGGPDQHGNDDLKGAPCNR